MSTTTSRRGFLSVVGAAGAGAILSSRLAWGQEKASPNAARAVGAAAALEVVRIEGDLHVVMGAGGNIAVHAGGEAVLVIDAGLPDRAKDVVAAVDKLSGGSKRRTLVNTHWHFDHIGANAAMAEAGYTLVGSTNCRKRLSETIFFEDLGMTAKPLPETARCAITFEQALVLNAPSTVTLTKIPAAHTDTDIVATFEKYNVFHTGDLFFNGFFPVIDRSTGGSLDGMIAATELMLTMVNDGTRIIPGHGPMATKGDLAGQLGLLKEVQGKLAPFGAAKTPMAEVLEKAPLGYLDDKWGRGFLRSPTFTKMAYGQYLTR